MAIALPNSVMIHVPKTGGSWCRSALKAAKIRHRELNPRNRHEGVKAVRRRVGNRFTFGFVRNPTTWLQSRWAYDVRGGKEYCDFNEWVSQTLSQRPDFVFRSMLDRLGYEQKEGCWQRGDCVVDFVGKTESLASDLIRALKLAGEKFDEEVVRSCLPQKVCSRAPNWRSRVAYKPEVLKMVVGIHRPIFELFGYGVEP